MKFTRENFNKLRLGSDRDKKTIMGLFIFGIVASAIAFLLFHSIQLQEVKLCEKWGGKLYQDGQCYPINDMARCITPEGIIKDAPGIKFNITFKEDKDGEN